MALCSHTAHSCVQGVSSGKYKSNDRYKQIREVAQNLPYRARKLERQGEHHCRGKGVKKGAKVSA